MKYNELEKYLFEISDEKFATFSKSLSNSEYISIGVKNPIIKSLVKEHKDDEELQLEDFKLGKYLEIDLFYISLGLIREKDIKKQFEFLDKNIKIAKSWAVTDCITSYLKKYDFDLYYQFFKKNYDSKYTYKRRISYVLGLKLRSDKNILKILPLIRLNEEYMVMMAEAWLLSVIAIDFEDEIFEYLSSISDIKLKRKTISKICDSFRYSDSSKNRFKGLRN